MRLDFLAGPTVFATFGLPLNATTSMRPKTYLWGHPLRFLFVFLGLVAAGVVAFSPIWLGLLGMEMQEASTGIQANEGNSVWGVLPWLGMFTLPIYVLIVVLTLLVCSLLIGADARKIFKSRRA